MRFNPRGTNPSRRKQAQIARALGAAVLGLACLGLGACRASSLNGRALRPTSVRPISDTQVHAGEILTGRLPPRRAEQAFLVDGVASSVLDFVVISDASNRAAPMVEVIDPDGRKLDVASNVVSPAGAATMRVRGIPLIRTGPHKVVVLPTKGMSSEGYYQFRHALRFPGPHPYEMNLSSHEPQPYTFTAPRFGRVTVRLVPARGSRAWPEVMGVQDPEGARALDRSRTPRGLLPPVANRLANGGLALTFTALQAGRYTLLAGAKAGREGAAVVRVDVQPHRPDSGAVTHPNAPPGEMGGGWPSTRASTRSASSVGGSSLAQR